MGEFGQELAERVHKGEGSDREVRPGPPAAKFDRLRNRTPQGPSILWRPLSLDRVQGFATLSQVLCWGVGFIFTEFARPLACPS